LASGVMASPWTSRSGLPQARSPGPERE
jgi:hypothetical protein